MALPSQIERSTENSRPVMSRGGRKSGAGSNRVWIGAALLVIVAGAVYGVMKLSSANAAAKPELDAKVALDAKNAPSSKTDGERKPVSEPKSLTKPAVTPPVTPPAAPLVTIDQGKSAELPKSLGEAVSGITPGDPAGGMNPPASEFGKPAPVDLTGTGAKPDAAVPKTEPAASPLTATGSTQGARSQIEAGDRAMAANKLVEARVLYSKALLNPEVSKGDAEVLRSKLTTINDDLVFSPKVTADDPLAETYTVAAGDALEKIRRKRELTTEWMFIERVNKLANPNDLKIGQKLKLVRGPFHAVVHKGEYRLDLFAGSPDDVDNWLFIRSFKVGLGESNGTPLGTFTIKSKQKNPPWTNPRNGEKFAADDPKNPIGEYWLGWQGVGDAAVHTGFGLHGTVEPESIGQSKSMGCVRMLPDDIATVYEMLAMKIGVVKVVP